jgi:Cytochrome c554 and c-prime
MKKTYILAALFPASVYVLGYGPWATPEPPFHSEAELRYFQKLGMSPHATMVPIDSNVLFPTARLCGGCHGYDPTKRAMVTTAGEDVNIYDDWRSSMMANSAKDPFWRAKVTQEILANPAHALELQDKCTSCHAPAGHYQAKLKEHKPFYTLADLYGDTLGLDGVNCQICHAQAPGDLGSLHSGALNFDTNAIRVAYGPYEMVFSPPMHEFVGITPKFGDQILDAGLCAGCHTLVTKTVDTQGAYTGSTFVEQATYHEWLNSRYDKEHDNITCQGCHIPSLQDEIIISANYQFLTPKYPFGVHELTGANVSMLKLMKEHRESLGISASDVHFDSTIASTLRMLQQKSIDLSIETGKLSGDTAEFRVKLHNKAGHKFPSGYPARRAWIEVEIVDAAGNVRLHSGKANADFSLHGEDANVESHHQIINQNGQVQIYELVPGDVNGNFTNLLERGHIGLKDNRLAPEGFRLDDPAYDTTQVIGINGDPDFNRDSDGSEGNGSDIVHYHIPINGYNGDVSIKVRVWYQSLPLKWMAPMFAYSSPEIDLFKSMFDAADLSPVLVAEKTLENVTLSSVGLQSALLSEEIKVWPSLLLQGDHLNIEASKGINLQRIEVWNAAGQLLLQSSPIPSLKLPAAKGIYIVVLHSSRGKAVRKVVRG